MENETDKQKINRIVEYIKVNSIGIPFEFDADQLREELFAILSYYGVNFDLTDAEYEAVVLGLKPLAKQFEIREAMLLVPNPEKEFFVGIRPTIVKKYRR